MDAQLEVTNGVRRLDALIAEVDDLVETGADPARLVHALRNLAHLATLLASRLADLDAPGADVVDLRGVHVRSGH